MNRAATRSTPIVVAMAALLLTQPWLATAEGLPMADPAELGMRPGFPAQVRLRVQPALDDGQFAGCVVAIGRSGRLAMLEAYGDRQVEPERRAMTVDTVFDLASLTKPVATATSIMLLVERGQLRLRQRIGSVLGDMTAKNAAKATIEQLLTHHAGYVPDNPLADYQHGPEEAWRRLLALEPQVDPGTRFRYSDVGFEMLGLIVERVADQPLDEFAREEVFVPLGMDSTGFCPASDLCERAAANEQREGRWMVGEVHDPRAYALGGVAGHAGLFSTASDLARYATMLLGEGRLDGTRVMGPLTVREMARPREVSGHRRTAGWDSLSGYSSNRGEFLSDRAFGHGGFTGTAMWIDPELDLFVIFLSNRLHPDGRGSVNDLAGRIGTIAAGAILDR